MHENIQQIESLSISSFNRDLMKLQRRRHGKVKKAICLMSETTTLHVHHAFLYTSLQSLQNYAVNDQILFNKYIWERERQGDKFYHLCLNSGTVPFFKLQPKFPSFK